MALATAHYELQVLRGDRWVIDAVLHDRGVALEEARRMTTHPDADGVRVVKECYSAASDTISVRTLFEEVRPRRPKPRRRPQPPPSAEPAIALPVPEPERKAVRPVPRPLPAEPPWWRSAAGLSSIAATALASVVVVLLLLA